MTIPCIVLAGGLGTRLRSAVPDLPKCLAPIAGRPFLEWQLLSLVERGILHFVLALGHGSAIVLESLRQPCLRGLSIETVIERELLGTGGAVRFAMDEFGLDDALIANGDTFLGGSLQTLLEPLDLEGSELMRIGTVRVRDRTRFGGVTVDSAQRVTSFLEKGQTGAGLINAGLYRMHRQAFEYEERGAFSMETQLMPRLITKSALQAREIAGPFIDIGVPADYRLFDLSVHDYVRQNQGRLH
jgi:D-glycero-alpha-D-manno-heptose 1-phosphate guanylyltransferase